MRKIRFRTLGLKHVNWNEYDFYIFPTLTYSNVEIKEGSGRAISLEWGHWAICIISYKVNKK